MLGHTDLPEGDTAAHATASSAGGTTNLSLLPPFVANLYELLSNTVSSVATMPYVHKAPVYFSQLLLEQLTIF